MKGAPISSKRDHFSPAFYQRAGAWSSLVVVLVGVLIALSLIAHWANPYQAAADDIRSMVQQNPNLLSNLDVIATTQSVLGPYLDAKVQSDVIDAVKSADPAALHTYFKEQAFDNAEIQTFLEDYTLTAISLQNIDWLLAKPEPYQVVRSNLEDLIAGDANRLDILLLGTQATAAHTQVNALRQQMIVGSTQLLTISTKPELFAIERSLSAAPKDDVLLDALLQANKTWRGFPISCQMLEGHLSQSANDLLGISSIVTTAMKNDQDWGYSLYSPITDALYNAKWLLAGILVAAFLLSVYAYKKVSEIEETPWEAPDVASTHAERTQGTILNSLEDKLKPRRSSPDTYQLQIIHNDGVIKAYSIRQGNIFRIGTDTACTGQIHSPRVQKAEIWIHSKNRTNTLEVIHASVPVYLNDREVTVPQELRSGDEILIADVRIKYKQTIKE